MARSRAISTKTPQPIAEAVEILLTRGKFGKYKSRNALVTGLMTYAAIFPRVHELTVGIDRLPESEQDIIHDFILRCVQAEKEIAAMLDRKPATAEALLKLATSTL